MIKPPLPADESNRLKELVSLEILDTDAEKQFDDIVELASYITGCPVSLISLVDVDRQWFKAKVGTSVDQTHRDISFCGHSIHTDDLLMVENALDDPRFFDNPLVASDPSIRFYAGQPLITSNGFRIGTLCTIDLVPRTLNDQQKKHLKTLSSQVVSIMELRLINRKQRLQGITQSQFLSNVSHEIRTPLNSILGYTSIAREQTAQNSKVTNYLEQIQRNSSHILTVVNNILNLSKAESSILELSNIDFTIRELKSSVFSLFQLEANRKGIILSFHIADDVPAELFGDFTQLKQILINLIGNALKFTEQGSVEIELTYSKDKSFLSFSVKDTGCGMTEAQASRLFKPFMQADASIVTKYGGTGLGLALSKQMAESMKGELKIVYSTSGKGSEFAGKVYLPISEKRANEVSTAHFDSIKNTLRLISTSANILIADDSEDNRFLFNHYLNQFSMNAEEAHDRESLLGKIMKKNYGVVFLDLQMGEDDGFEILKQIRNLRTNLKVVAFTAHNSVEYKKKALLAGFDGFLSKPFEINQLAEILFDAIVLNH